jgi:nitroimidazol reductase NimA-like FMN-containing flavoprotein (pyridoxamine 5'-phosphate oxidase superfamily)
MNEPTTTLDSRFSDPNAVAPDWKETRHILESAQLFWICTVRADGRPHVTPLVAVWLDGAVHFCTGSTEQKAINLTRNSHVVLMTGCNQWEKGIDVVVEGDAVPVTDNETLKRLAEAWTTKWDGQWRYEVRDGAFHHREGITALVFAVRPTKVFAFSKGVFGQTRYQF